MMKYYTALGMMSGTSMDGIDVALLKSDGRERLERGPSGFFAYDKKTRTLLEKALLDAKGIVERSERPGVLGDAEALISRLHVEAVRAFLKARKLEPGQIDVIGFHGQTVIHKPHKAVTVQLGDGHTLAQNTGIAVVYDMRANDMENGGQGAPLVPLYHQALSHGLTDKYSGMSPKAFINIGGIANISYVGCKGELIAFDTGPGNALIDQWIADNSNAGFDEGGGFAAAGKTSKQILSRYLTSEYFAKPSPKSLDRSDFPPLRADNLSIEDGARTLVRLSAESIFGACKLLPQDPALWIICGGGRHNRVMMDELKILGEAHSACVISAETAGFNGDAMEAEAWAYLAIRALQILPLTFPSTTGVTAPLTGGRIAHPEK